MPGPPRKLRPSGGYRTTASFQTTTLIYDATHWFCERFLDSRSRMADQMVQAARSGRQNIAEGSRASATSSQTELRLVNVARASLDELLLDFGDFLRHRRGPQWPPDSPAASAVRAVPAVFRKAQSDRSEPSGRSDLNVPAGVALTIPPSVEARLTKRQQQMMADLAGGEVLTSKIVQQRFKISAPVVHEDFKRLIEEGLIERVGAGRATRYVPRSTPESSGNR